MALSNVCHRGNSGHVGDASLGPLMTQLGHELLAFAAMHGLIRFPSSERLRLPTTRIHFEKLCPLDRCERKEPLARTWPMAPRAAAHQAPCIIVVTQSDHLSQLVSYHIPCAVAQRHRIRLTALASHHDFLHYRPRQ